MAKGGRIVRLPAPAETPLLELQGNLRVVPIRSERGALWYVLAVGGINLADAVIERFGLNGTDAVRVVVYGPDTDS